MALTRQTKEKIVAEVSGVATKALSAVIALNHGLPVADMTDFRAKARAMQVYVKVVPNTLAARSILGTEFECLTDELVGPTVLIFSLENPGAAGRLAKEFAKGREKFGIKALAIGGKVFPASQIDVLASLPSREEALATLLSVMQAPVTKLARTLSETYAQLVRVTAAVGDHKKAA